MIAKRSPRARASFWSWVTNTAVKCEPLVELVDLRPHLVAQPGVEIAQRLVEEHQVGSGDEAPCQRDALLLPTAQLGGIPVEQLTTVDEVGHVLDPPLGTRSSGSCAPAAGSRCSSARSCEATAHTTGTPCRGCACRATCRFATPSRRPCARRTRSSRSSGSRGRRGSAASSSCRNRSGRGGRGTRPPRSPGRDRRSPSSAACRRNACRVLRSSRSSCRILVSF